MATATTGLCGVFSFPVSKLVTKSISKAQLNRFTLPWSHCGSDTNVFSDCLKPGAWKGRVRGGGQLTPKNFELRSEIAYGAYVGQVSK